MADQAPQLAGFNVQGHIGSGGSADVWQVVNDQGDVFAAKVFRDGTASGGRREWKALNRHAGPHVVPAIDLLRDAEGRTVLIMPMMHGGSLYDVVSGRGRLTLSETVTALAPVTAALAGMHETGETHGDLTPRNVLFDESGKPYLADLGATRLPAEGGAQEWGSAGFVAPELLEGDAPRAAADVYALGATLWFALTGEIPQPAALRPRLEDVVGDVAPDVISLVTACLTLTPSARPDATDVHRRLVGATQPSAVPLDRRALSDGADDPTAAMSMTRRLRHEARQNQQAAVNTAQRSTRRARLPRSSSESSTPSGRGPTAGDRRLRTAPSRKRAANADSAEKSLLPKLVLLGGSVAAATVGAFLVPVPGNNAPETKMAASVATAQPVQAAAKSTGDGASRSSHTTQPNVSAPTGRSHPEAAGQASGATSGERKPAPMASGTAATDLPNQHDIQQLLNCRADAWNTTSDARLGQCLATESQAYTDDHERLAEARTRKVTYEGLHFTVTKLHSVTAAGGQSSARATVRRSEFTARSARGSIRQGEQLTTVRLVLTGGPGTWRISSWNLVD